jgi:hypothetical protein
VLSTRRSWKALGRVLREGLAEPGDEVGPPVAQREWQRLVMQHSHAGVAQARGGQLVHHPVADDDPAARSEVTTAADKLGYRGGDGGPPQPRWEVVDRPVDRVDQPEPVGLEPLQHGWLVGQVNLGVVAVQALGDAAVQIVTQRRRRLVVVDEAWTLAHQPAGARFLFRLAKAARKHACGLTVLTQDAADLLASDLGQAVAANAATQLLLGQAPQAIHQLTRAFALTEGERQRLLAARVGEGLLAGPGGQRAWFAALASPAEHALVTTDLTDPAEQLGERP